LHDRHAGGRPRVYLDRLGRLDRGSSTTDATFHAVYAEVLRVDRRGIVLCLPVAAKELTQARVVGLARSALDVFQVLGEPKAKHLQHAIEWFIGRAYGSEGARAIEVVPVFKIRCRFE
jgi:hypothetical protein